MSKCEACGAETTRPLEVGDQLLGFCGGWFGRDSYHDKIIEALGPDWVVARDEDGCLHIGVGGPSELIEYRGKR